MTITANLVKELREKTGAGMMDCKVALTEVKGDIEAAIDWLRKKGLSKAAKKAGRIAAEGLVGITTSGKSGAVVEINSETDFVARNEQFQDLVTKVTGLATEANGNVAELLAATFPGKSHSVEEQVKELIATIGENMTVRRTAVLEVPEGAVGSYVHGQIAPGLGKIGVLVALESSGKNTEELAAFARQIAMHVAATSPVALDLAGVPAETLQREKAILADKNQGKPPQVIEKIVASGLKSYAKDNCLLDQAYIHDPSKSVAQAVKEFEGKAGGPVKLVAFVRYALGEGIEKKEEDFAAEVAAAVGASN
jgi:elongation factor Ts